MAADRLPIPDKDAQAHSLRVMAAVRDRIAESGAMSFGDYMEMALYANGLGYYVTGNEVIGAAGDFVTAPVISPLFGKCIAQQCAQSLGATEGNILEFGAGTGALAAGVLEALEPIQAMPDHYLILEPSAVLAARQQTMLKDRLPAALLRRVEWISEIPHEFTGVVLANEVLDAIPVERFVIAAEGEPVLQLFVDCDDNGLHYVQRQASQEVASAVSNLQRNLPFPLPEGYCSEVNLLLSPWLEALAYVMRKGLLLLIDYGYPRKEYYIQERVRGTLRCYFRHHMHEDALLYPGLQDITSDIDFTLVAEAAERAGLDLHGFTTQAQFLMANGLAEHADLINASSDIERFALAEQVKTLSLGGSMGDRFQVMALSKALETELDGFRLAEFSHRL